MRVGTRSMRRSSRDWANHPKLSVVFLKTTLSKIASEIFRGGATK